MLRGGIDDYRETLRRGLWGCEVSTAWRVKLKVPAAVGVPVMTPAGVREMPAGSWPALIDQAYGVVPPVAASVWL